MLFREYNPIWFQPLCENKILRCNWYIKRTSKELRLQDCFVIHWKKKNLYELPFEKIMSSHPLVSNKHFTDCSSYYLSSNQLSKFIKLSFSTNPEYHKWFLLSSRQQLKASIIYVEKRGDHQPKCFHISCQHGIRHSLPFH